MVYRSDCEESVSVTEQALLREILEVLRDIKTVLLNIQSGVAHIEEDTQAIERNR